MFSLSCLFGDCSVVKQINMSAVARSLSHLCSLLLTWLISTPTSQQLVCELCSDATIYLQEMFRNTIVTS